jgi:hypothetical protein
VNTVKESSWFTSRVKTALPDELLKLGAGNAFLNALFLMSGCK